VKEVVRPDFWPTVLLGKKSGLADAHAAGCGIQRGREFHEKENQMSYFETSAKTEFQN
jgi:hypothetical protein